jgi:leucyl-tRNA synthetase
MELLRDFDSSKVTDNALNDQVILKATQMIAPLAPHLAEELWATAGFKTSIFKSRWPSFDPEAVVGDTIEVAVQVNGKLRDSLQIAADSSQEDVEKIAFESQKVRNFTDGKQIVKRIYIPGRLLNIVIKG